MKGMTMTVKISDEQLAQFDKLLDSKDPVATLAALVAQSDKIPDPFRGALQIQFELYAEHAAKATAGTESKDPLRTPIHDKNIAAARNLAAKIAEKCKNPVEVADLQTWGPDPSIRFEFKSIDCALAYKLRGSLEGSSFLRPRPNQHNADDIVTMNGNIHLRIKIDPTNPDIADKFDNASKQFTEVEDKKRTR